MRILGPLYYAKRLKHSGQRGSIILPETARETYADGLVIACGPGDDLPMQARAGDRVLCAPVDWEAHQADHGFVSDSRLLGVIRAPAFACVEPAGSYVLVRPDPREAVRLSRGGVLIAGYSLAGEGRREKARGYELLLEYARLLDSARYQEAASPYDRHRLEESFAEGLTASEREAFSECLDKQREASVGQSGQRQVTLKESEYRAKAPLRLPDPIQSGVILGIGPDARTTANLMERVSWGRAYRAVRITVAGELLMLVQAEDLECVLPVGVDVEWKAAA